MLDKPASLFLGIDFGTSGCRAAVIDAQGELLTLCKEDLPAPVIKASSVSQDAQIWRAGLIHLIEKISKQVALEDIAAIAIDGTSGSVLLCDEHGQTSGHALMYNDASGSRIAAQIKTVAPETSGAHGASSGLAKLAVLYEKQKTDTPVCATNYATICAAIYATTQASWLSGLLTGNFTCIDENNALKLGYDVINRHWPEWIENIVDTKKVLLPAVVPPGTIIGRVTNDFARASGLSTNTQIIAGTTDSIAAFIATGIDQVGEAVTTLGSTLVIKLLSDKPIFEPRYGIYSHRLNDKWLVGGASNAGCAVLRTFFSQQQLDEMTCRLNPDQHIGLNYYPLMQKGERFPIADSEKQPRLSPRPNNDLAFFQAILEGLTHIELMAYEKLHELGAPYPTRILTSGGGSQNPPWIKMRNNTLKTNVAAAYQTEAAYGSALLARNGYNTGTTHV